MAIIVLHTDSNRINRKKDIHLHSIVTSAIYFKMAISAVLFVLSTVKWLNKNSDIL